MKYQEAHDKLEQISQTHILKFWSKLTQFQQETLLSQIEDLDINIFLLQQEKLHQVDYSSSEEINPYLNYTYSGEELNAKIGAKLISEGKVGCLLIAGGQGTRLRFKGPKGLYPITPIKRKTLFQFFAEKVVAASKLANCQLPLAIMTSPLNDEIIRQHFADNEYFGLHPDQLHFFTQQMLPLLNPEGNLFLEEKYKIAEGPDGNGYTLKYFVQQKIWQHWHEAGVSLVNCILIDNPLADPFDAELVGFHSERNIDITVKAIARRNAQEKVGVLVDKGGKVRIIEYSELPDEEGKAILPEGTLKHLCANTGMYCFSMDFIRRSSEETLPLHRAFKAAHYLSDKGIRQQAHQPIAWKFETFIFDVLQFANRVQALLYPRDVCFAPLKNATGPDSVASVRRALQKESRRIFSQITGNSPPASQFELAPDFYYPTNKLLAKWKGASAPQSQYIEP